MQINNPFKKPDLISALYQEHNTEKYNAKESEIKA